MAAFIDFNKVNFNTIDFESLTFQAPEWNEPVKDLSSIGKFNAKSSNREILGNIFNSCVFAVAGLTILSSSTKIRNQLAPLLKSLNKINFIKNLQDIKSFKLVLTACAFTSLVLAARKVISIAIGYIIYPVAAESLLKDYKIAREDAGKNLKWVNPITLSKNGVNYEGFLVASDIKNLTNGDWVQVAGGNGSVAEESLNLLPGAFNGKNILFINGPGVGRSSGVPTSYNMGAAQEAGLQFLEDVVKAKKILLYGLSLGGGAQAKAISMHTFKKDVGYMVWSDRTFDKLSNAASAMVTCLAKPAFFILGIELDGVKGAKKLQELNIPHLVTQNNKQSDNGDILAHEGAIDSSGSDGVIANNASLYVGLRKNDICDLPRIQFFGNKDVPHTDTLKHTILASVGKCIQNFFE